MDAVVMAAGEGRRLRPFTERWPKAVLPIDGRPIVATLLRELAAAGLHRTVVVTGHLAERIERLLGDGSAFGLDVRYARQPKPLGSADAVRRAVETGARPPLVVLAADTVFRPGDIAAARRRWLASGSAGGLGVRPSSDDEKTLVRVENGRVATIGGNRGNVRAAPLWFLDDALASALARVPGPPFELARAFQDAVEAGAEILGLEIGPTRDLTYPADVVAANFPYLWNSR